MIPESKQKNTGFGWYILTAILLFTAYLASPFYDDWQAERALAAMTTQDKRDAEACVCLESLQQAIEGIEFEPNSAAQFERMLENVAIAKVVASCE